MKKVVYKRMTVWLTDELIKKVVKTAKTESKGETYVTASSIIRHALERYCK